ncbi:MAG: trigger factor [Actinomycetota bacterium]|nr:trigger factor [Actinomycetota bacterium]
MKSSVETLEGNKVKVYVEVEESEFDKDIDRAFKALAREVNLPGFRAGKAPRRVLEARFGVAPAREQALRESIPTYLAKALAEHQVDLISSPEIEITDGTESGPVEFDATVEIRPEITVPGYGGLRIELPSPVADDDDIDEAVEAERRRHGSLQPVDRAAQDGDHVTLDIAATRDGEPVAGLTVDDWSYELGQGWIADDFDEQLSASNAGDELTFTTTPKGTEDPVDFTVSVSAVQELVLPDLDDEWVSENLGEHDTVEEWLTALAEQLTAQKLDVARNQFVAAATEALGELVEIEPPEAMVQSDLQARVRNTMEQFQARGIELGQFLSATGQDPDDFMNTLREQSMQAVKLDLALRAVAAAEAFEVSEDDLDAEFTQMGMRFGEKPAKVRRAYETQGAMPDLVNQIRKSRALDHLLHHVDIVDSDGQPIDRDLILGHSHDDDDHDRPGDVQDDNPKVDTSQEGTP